MGYSRRQHVTEQALAEGRFAPFDSRAALGFTLAGAMLGLATLASILIDRLAMLAKTTEIPVLCELAGPRAGLGRVGRGRGGVTHGDRTDRTSSSYGGTTSASQPELLQRRADGLPDAEHRPDRRRGDAVHGLVRRAGCTAGRSSFITGGSVYRTGLSKVGMPGMDVGLQAEDVTIAELLKPLGYATGQFGKNHLGDLNKYLPTVHGFDEFFGNLTT